MWESSLTATRIARPCYTKQDRSFDRSVSSQTAAPNRGGIFLCYDLGMDYDLAKQLKEAGFPYTTGGYFIDPSGLHVMGEQTAFRSDLGYVPTLEELIEACGDDAFMLEKGRTGWGGSHNNWNASKVVNGMQYVNEGPGPVTAVARLWLALNKT
jgi:hypothetical protein